MSVSILGQNISLVRPTRIKLHNTYKAWKGAKCTGRKTRKLTKSEKQLIAFAMGYELRAEVRSC